LAGLNDLPAPILIMALIAFSLIVAGLTYYLIERPLIHAAKRARRRLFKPSRD
jgi:peptidoglycan/LPS O-acetylase OafA/YrhL